MLTNGEPERERPEQRSRIKLPSPFDKSRSASQLAQSFFVKALISRYSITESGGR
jgi:hypothetical protein